MEANLEALARAGVAGADGFRAPIFSLSSDSSWAYGVMREFGFTYSEFKAVVAAVHELLGERLNASRRNDAEPDPACP